MAFYPCFQKGIIRLWNSGAEAIFGYSAEEAIGETLDLIVPEKLREKHWEGYRKVMATGVTKYGSDVLAVPAIKRDSSRLSVEFTIVLLQDDTGKPIGTAAIMRDVTERWQKEKELKKRLAELEDLTRLCSRNRKREVDGNSKLQITMTEISNLFWSLNN
jgi:PAS domain S-box-containing protein